MPTVTVDGYQFDYVDSGEGPTVLMLHGFPQDKECWAPLTETLVAAGYRVVAFDQRGYSPGARPTANSAYTLDQLTDDAFGVLDALQIDRAHIVGHDWGGAVAWACTARAPQRMLSLTVLSTPHPRAMKRVMTRSTQGLKSWYMGLFMVPKLAEFTLNTRSPVWRLMMRGLPTEVIDRYASNAAQPGRLSGMLAWYRAMPLAMRSPLDWQPITVDTLYIWGRRDPALGFTAAQATADEVVGNYHFVVLPDHGHWLPELATDDVAPLLLDHLAHSG